MNRTYFIRLTKNSSVDFGTGHYCIDHLGGWGWVGRFCLCHNIIYLLSPPPLP